MSRIKTIKLEKKYAFPLFTKSASSVPLAGNEKLVISDIWALWDYVIKKLSFEKPFMNSLLEQAKYFYKAAEESPTKSQPLLYYYSFLNLAKVMINIEKKYGKDSFVYMHGIKEHNNGKFSLSEIEIHPIKTAIKNVSAELVNVLDDICLARSTIIKVKYLLSHCVGIHRTYCELYNSTEVFCRLSSMELRKKGKVLEIESKICCDDKQIILLNAAGYKVSKIGDDYIWNESYTMTNSNITRNDYYNFSKYLRGKGIWYFIGRDGYTKYLSTNTANRYSPEFIVYNTMFYLGSITRYHPYLFDEIFSDKEQWLMSEFLKTQPKQFLYLATSKILGQFVLQAGVSF